MTQAVAFDLNSLIDGIPVHLQALNMALGDHAIKPVGIEDFKREYHGKPTIENLNALKLAKRIKFEQIPTIMKRKQQYTKILINRTVKFDPMVYCIVAGLRRLDIKVSVISEGISDTTNLVLMNLRITPDAVITGEDVENGKPNSECYLRACRKMEVKTYETLVIETSYYGMQAAQIACCRAIKVQYGEVTPKLIWDNLEGVR